MANEQYVVIGAGQFGAAVARNLARQRQSVLVIDRNIERVEALASEVDAAVAADATEERALLELGVERMSAAVVAIGSDALEASIMTTALLRQLGVPRIVARAVGDLHARVLGAVGAHEVVHPDREMGHRVALRLVRPTIMEQLELGNASLVEVEMPAQFADHNLKELDVRNRYGVSVIAIRRGDEVLANPNASLKLALGDVLLLIGSPEAVHHLAGLV